MSDVLADAQERLDIATQLAATLFVEAGAGTGKTTALVSRIVALVCGGTPLSDLAAITFTEKAAAELKDRLRDALEERATASGTPQECRERCGAAMEEIDGAAIQTLHSFAQRILAQYPVEAGLPPLLEMRDEIEATLAFDERWAQFLDELLNGSATGVPLETAVTLGLNVRSLRAVAESFHQRWDRLRGGTTMFATAEAPALDLRALTQAVDEAMSAADFCAGCDDKLEGHIRDAIGPFARRLARARDDDERIAALVETEKLRLWKNYGTKDHWVGPTKAEVQEMIEAVAAERDRILAEMRRACMGPLLEAIRGFVVGYAEERRGAGTLEFHDLLLMARELLAENAVVRRSLGARYKRLLIDEFQDTDPVQIEIAALLAGTGGGGGSWEELDVEDGRLFFVGDPKQSIYRFRSADIELYERAHQRFGEQTRYLTVNFRSGPGIIEWVNRTFDDMFENANGGGEPAQVKYVQLVAAPGRTDSAQGKARAVEPVRLIGTRREEASSGNGKHRGVNVKVVRRVEAGEIADAIQTIRREAWMVSGEDGPRPAHYRDITILLPARTTLGGIERALEEEGVPFRVESQSLLYATQEVRDLTSVLAAVDDPTDEVAVVAALRSPAFACSDRELEAWANSHGRWDYSVAYEGQLEATHAVVESMAALRELHNARWFVGVNEMVERVIRERHLFEVAFANRRPRETWQRLRFVLERARAFEDAGGASLRQFVDWLRQQAKTEVRVTESVVPESDDDAVRIMTVHAAKGLEFPIVFLAGLNAEPVQRWPAVVWGSGELPEVRIGKKDAGFETEAYEAARLREERMDALEKDRLLYVAATRARDHLIVSLHHKPPKKVASHAARLHDRWVTTPRWQPEAREQQAPLFGDAAVAEVVTVEARQAWLAERERTIAKARRAPVFAATAIAHEDEGEAGEKAEPEDDDAPWRRGRAGTAMGRAVHAVLQTVDLKTGAGVDATSRAQAAAEGLAGRESVVAARVRSALGSSAVREAVRSRYWREVYVAAPVGDAVVEGFIDLLYETPEGLVVVDYKTDSAETADQIDAAMKRYVRQGAAYALALGEVLGKPVAKCVFVFAASEAAQERTVTTLKDEVAAVREAVLERARTGGMVAATR